MNDEDYLANETQFNTKSLSFLRSTLAIFGIFLVAANTHQKGVYEFLIRSVGKTERGETIVREEALSKYVGPSEPDTPQPAACFPCSLLRLLIAVIVILLLIILYYLIVCCCRKRFAQRG